MKRTLCWRFLLFLILTGVFLGGCAGKNLSNEHQSAYQAYQAGDYELAAKKFERLVRTIPKDAELWFRLGNAYAKAKKPKEAVNAYENALLRNPEMGKAWYNMGLVYLQAALKSFVDMENYVEKDDPVGKRGKVLRDEVFSLLEGQAPGHESKD